MGDLRLLLQAASGDGRDGPGVVYFYIARRDLERRRFDRAFAFFSTT